MSRYARNNRVFLIEEPIFGADDAHLQVAMKGNVRVVTPHLPHGLPGNDIDMEQVRLLKGLFQDENISSYFFWYYTPMALGVGNHFSPKIIIYDCMDELSLFKNAPAMLKEREKELFEKADLVFTGGHNLYQAKKDSHNNIFPFPSSIDKDHFAGARKIESDVEDQANIPHPRFGFYGVIDERFDIDLIREVAEMKPEWHFIIIGPVVKIDPETLPVRDNIHYMGGRSYDELPDYLAGWDVAVIPFLRNDSTKYISPTKTPEYLAGGKPVISTSITDVVTPYGTNNLVHIADTADDFIKAAELELNRKDYKEWLEKTDRFLSKNSWDKTWSRMMEHITETIKNKLNGSAMNIIKSINPKENEYV
jgi:UDP-galactopyranose mutase